MLALTLAQVVWCIKLVIVTHGIVLVDDRKVFLRYGHRGEILRAIKHEWDKLKIEVPPVKEKYIHRESTTTAV